MRIAHLLGTLLLVGVVLSASRAEALSLEQVNTTSPQTLSNKTLSWPSLTGVVNGAATYITPSFSGTIGGVYGFGGSPSLLSNLTVTTGRTMTVGSNVLIGFPSADKLNAFHLAISGQTLGDLLVASSSNTMTPLQSAADGNVLRSTGVSSIPLWGKVRLSGTPTDISGVLTPANGGTGFSVAPTNGQIPIGSGGLFVPATLTAGPGVAITSGAGNVTIGAPTLLSELHNLQCENDGAFPGTKMNCSVSALVAINSSSGRLRITAPGTLVCNIALAGPIPGGRDQAGAFGANQWVSIWAITNGTSTACLASLSSDQISGPTLPSGYTHFAYLTSVRANAVGDFLNIVTRGRTVFYKSQETIQTVTSAGTTTPSTLSWIPPSATEFMVQIRALLSTNGSGAAAISTQVGGFDISYSQFSGNVYVNGASQSSELSTTIPLPNVASQLALIVTNWSNPSNIASESISLKAIGYTIQNGAR